MNIEDKRYELEQFLEKQIGEYPDSQILLLHEMQLILQDSAASRRMKSMAKFVFRLAEIGNSEWLDKFSKEKYRKGVNYGAFQDIDIDYDAMIAEHEAKNARWISDAIDNAHNHSDDSD